MCSLPKRRSPSRALQGHQQIDCLLDVGVVLGNGTKDEYWRMQNGYALPTSPEKMEALAVRLRDEPSTAAAAEAALRVGVHWDTQVMEP